MQPPEKITHPQAWVDLYADGLFRYALRRTGDKEVAEDLVRILLACIALLGKRQADAFRLREIEDIGKETSRCFDRDCKGDMYLLLTHSLDWRKNYEKIRHSFLDYYCGLSLLGL